MKSLLRPVILGLACAALLPALCSCPQRETRPLGRSHGPDELATQFSPLATARQLGTAYAMLGGARGLETLHSAPDQSALLLEMRGGRALWVDLSRAAEVTELELDRELLHVDMQRRLAYALDAPQPGEFSLLRRQLPAGDWQPLLASGKVLPRGRVMGLLSHPAREGCVALLRTNFSPGGSAAGDPPAPAAGMVRLWDCAWQISPAGEPRLQWQRELLLPVDEMLAPAAWGLLADGSLAYSAPDSAALEISGPEPGSPAATFPLAPGRRVVLSADSGEPVVWAYLAPESSGAGTQRSDSAVQVGTLIVFGAEGELERMACGQVPMGSLAGNWAERRAALCQPSVGVAIADFARHELRWPLRQSASRQLFLAGNGSQVLDVLPQAIVGIGVDDLAGLGSALTASQVLPRQELKQVRPVAEALGWDWGSTQISPLLASTGKLTMFDGKDVASSLAEFEWDRERARVQRLLLTRIPGMEDEALLKLEPAALDARLRELLKSMGWPNAAAEPDSGFHGEGELQAVYLLEPDLAVTPGPGADALVPVSPGEFTVWVTADAALWSLEAAGERLPAGSLSTYGVREKAAAAALELAQAAAMQPLSVQVGLQPRGGWVLLDPKAEAEGQLLELSDQKAEGALPAVELEVLLRDAQSDRLYRLLLNAADGSVLRSSSREADALLLTQAARRFGPPAEFGPPPAAAPQAQDPA